MSVYYQKKDAKKELFTIKMNKMVGVSENYHWFFKLWHRAGILLEDWIDIFIGSVSYGILNILQAQEYKDFTKVLEDTRQVEGYQKNVINNLYSNKDKPEKISQLLLLSRGVPRITAQITASKNIASDVKIYHPDNKFGPLSKKLEG